MRPDPREEGRRWLAQAVRDLDDARYLAAGARNNLACYMAQQAAEKALKAVLYAHGETSALGHSAAVLAERVAQIAPAPDGMASRAATLDKFYIPTRYPNGLPGGIPSDAFDADDAVRAIGDAADVLDACRVIVER